MSLYFQIKELYPDILDSEFVLQDNSDGKGAYIREWKSTYLKPTQTELNSVKDIAIQKANLVEIRAKRNVLLQESDWTQIPDSPLTQVKKDEWKLYRQKLRDMPQDYIAIGSVKYSVKLL